MLDPPTDGRAFSGSCAACIIMREKLVMSSARAMFIERDMTPISIGTLQVPGNPKSPTAFTSCKNIFRRQLMGDDGTTTIRAAFETREAADLAVEQSSSDQAAGKTQAGSLTC